MNDVLIAFPLVAVLGGLAILYAARPRPPLQLSPLAEPPAAKLRGGELAGTTIATRTGQTLVLGFILGVGANSFVYEGIPPDGSPTLAVKVLTEGEWTAEMQGRFEREVRIGSTLSHPNMVKVVDWGTMPEAATGRPFIVMEKLEGRLLHDILTERGDQPFPPEQVVGWMAELLDVMGLVHAQGIIHRDLKPENVWVQSSGSLKVLDFGIARQQADSGPVLTRAFTAMGTPRYMSPEHLNAKTVTGQSDLYSIGVMAYEMLTGRPPFHEAKSLQQTLMQIATGKYPDIQKLNPALPSPLADWVRHMMARAPEHRYPDAAQALRALPP